MRKKQLYSTFFSRRQDNFSFLGSILARCCQCGCCREASVERHHGLCHSRHSWFQLAPVNPPRTKLSPSLTCGALSKTCIKRYRYRCARYRKNKKSEKDQREYLSQSRKDKNTMLEKISILQPTEDLHCLCPSCS